MIVCIGDSVTAGQYLSPMVEPWPRQLRGRHHVLAAGVPGDTTRLALERFPRDVQAYRPERVVIQFGHNDANRWLSDGGLPRVSLKAYTANLEEMVERARAFGAEPVLVGMFPPNRDADYVADCQRYDEAAREVASDTGATWIPMWPHFDASHLLADGLHLNADGHRLYAEIVAGAL